MTKEITLLIAIGLLVMMSSLLLLGANLGDAADSIATQPEAVVTIAVAPPPQPLLNTAPPLNATASLPATVPTPEQALATPVEPADIGERAEQSGIGEAAVINVLARPSPVFAGPSSSAVMLYGFPAGRPLRVLGHNAGFAQIVDLKTGAKGWIDEMALARDTLTAPVRPESKPAPRNKAQPLASIDPDPKLAKSDRRTAAQLETPTSTAPDQKRNRRLFGGLKRADGRDGGFSSFLTRAFGGGL